ncbi:substrate-binding domain-containing protein [Paenibacillus sp. LHD-38]|uniref:sugar ABC transporter substrate-binding protein n=1 Tax=Paenibacillus sp. LHD-38 TaxID=3072143 RepID=UPI00280F620E|nr:substrate-binding domain-containing protein [Paenibacillus sp. LHD-38]MDQ8735637.1 substrate-binding domain-containing protein [Paenibacillus sp. LHD-38]
MLLPKRRSWFFMFLFLALFTVSCQSAPPTSLVNSSEPSTIPSNRDRVFGIIFPMAIPAYEKITENAENTAKAANIRLLVSAPDEANLEQQIRIMESMIKQKVDGIAIAPVNPEALAPVINKAVEQGIPVICFETDSPNSKRLSYIGADNYDTGRQLGKATDLLLGGKGMVMVGTGMSEMFSLKERLEGLLDYLNSETEIEVLEVRYNDGREDLAITELEDMINAHPHFNAFLSLDFVSSSASILIWKAYGLNRYVLSIGSTPNIEEALLNGQVTSIISQYENQWGRKIIEALMKVSEGEIIPEMIDTGILKLEKGPQDDQR